MGAQLCRSRATGDKFAQIGIIHRGAYFAEATKAEGAEGAETWGFRAVQEPRAHRGRVGVEPDPYDWEMGESRSAPTRDAGVRAVGGSSSVVFGRTRGGLGPLPRY